MTLNYNYANRAGAACVQRPPAGRTSTIQSIGQLLKQRMDTVNKREISGDGAEDFGGLPRNGGLGTVQLVDTNNNAGARHKFSCWDDKNCANSGKGCAADDGDEQNQFQCCAVCSGRIWQMADKNETSLILGECHQQQQLLKLDGGEELLVHSACFRCATCGLDLIGEEEQHVVKRSDRFYCALHGRQQQQMQRQNGTTADAVHGNGNRNGLTNGYATAWKVPLLAERKLSNYAHNEISSWGKMTTMKNNISSINGNNNKSSSNNEQLQKWWDRRSEEFNRGKGSTTFRYYGSNRQLSVGAPPPVPPKLSSIATDNNATNLRMTGGGDAAVLYDGGHDDGRNEAKLNVKKNSLFIPAGKGRRKSPPMVEDRCEQCGIELSGSFVLAKSRCWCPEHFVCANSACFRRLLESGFIEEPKGRKNYCPVCYECLIAPVCRKCFLPLTETCLNALGEKWHNECFSCTHCRKPFGTLAFFVEDGKPYCEDDWNLLFTTKCSHCAQPIKVGQKWLEALGGQFHANCFNCAACGTGLEGKTYFERDQQPFCRAHAPAAGIV